MRSFLVALVALIALTYAMPITPSAPRLQKRAEQFRLQGLREFEIAERLSTPTDTTTDPWRTRLNAKFHALFQDKEDFSGDVAPGSLQAPQALPISSPSEEMTVYERICALFLSAESDLGYEGKEAEMRRPQGSRDWKRSYGGFRRK